MNTLHFTIDIHAPKQKVWDVMLGDQTYREWTAAFHEGSYYEGSWDKGSKMLFLGPDDNGQPSGMVSRIAENIPYQYISIEHLGEVAGGQEDTTSDRVKQWTPAYENYSFDETDGVTTLTIEMTSEKDNPEMTEMFKQMWPAALDKLKEIAERE